MTSEYKRQRNKGRDKKLAVSKALAMSMPSIIVSGMGLFAATFGVAVYSKIDMISSLCVLLARGALISMASAIFVLPAALRYSDKLICKTTKDMKEIEA